MFSDALYEMDKATERYMVEELQDDVRKAEERADMDRMEPRLLAYPAMALNQTRMVINNMAGKAMTSVTSAIDARREYSKAGVKAVNDLEDVLDIELTDDEYDTIAGLVLSLLDRVPEETEKPTVKYKNLDIKVLKVEENAISKVMIHINPEDEALTGDAADEEET